MASTSLRDTLSFVSLPNVDTLKKEYEAKLLKRVNSYLEQINMKLPLQIKRAISRDENEVLICYFKPNSFTRFNNQEISYACEKYGRMIYDIISEHFKSELYKEYKVVIDPFTTEVEVEINLTWSR